MQRAFVSSYVAELVACEAAVPLLDENLILGLEHRIFAERSEQGAPVSAASTVRRLHAVANARSLK